jgi:hypothetical protein
LPAQLLRRFDETDNGSVPETTPSLVPDFSSGLRRCSSSFGEELVEQIFQAVVMATFAREVSMSEYVEARYARLVLREARLAEEEVASKLINELLHDLKSFQNLNSARTQAVTSIRQLALNLDRPQSLHARDWEAADQAAEAWCRNAFH